MAKKDARDKVTSLLEGSLEQLQSLRDVPVKRVGQFRYLHLCSCGCTALAGALTGELTRLFSSAFVQYDLIMKLDGSGHISVLVYPEFAALPHPMLRYAVSLPANGETLTIRRYRDNPPVLHRKELLLSSDDPTYAPALALTHAEEKAGLLSRPFDFGFRRQWDKRLASAGYAIDGYALRRRSPQ